MSTEELLQAPEQAEEERRSAMRAADDIAGRQGYAALGIFAVTFVLIAGVVTMGSRPPTITLAARELSIRACG